MNIEQDPELKNNLDPAGVETQPGLTLIDVVPGSVSSHDGTGNDRYVIDRVPGADEIASGLDYDGEMGEFEAGNDLLLSIKELDPENKLADPDYRKNVIRLASPSDVMFAVGAINQKLTGSEGLAVSETSVVVGMGDGDDQKVGFIGLSPDNRSEVFNAGIEEFPAPKSQSYNDKTH